MRIWIASLLFLFCFSAISAQQGLNVVIFGDSNTWLGGDDCSKPRGWNTWFKKELSPASCRSYARSGATWTNTPSTIINTSENIGVLGDNNVIYNQTQRLFDDIKNHRQPEPQLILIMAGTNDVWFNDKRPQVFQSPTLECPSGEALYALSPAKALTLADAVSMNVLLLQQRFPTVRIILLTPMQTTAAPLEDIARAGDIIEDTGRLLSCSVIRMDKDECVSSLAEKLHKRFTADGTHTNEAGARRIGSYVAQQVKALLELLTPNS